VPAWISLKNLAEIMLAEGARRCAELPPWDELRRQAHKALLNLSAADFQRWLSPDAPFPACESLLILPVERHSPALSSHLPGDDSGLPAARRLLAQASAALAAGKDELADALAARAAAESSKLAANAQEIRVQAACMRAERERLADAQRFHRLLERFDRELEQLTLDRVDKPRATLALMQALTADTQRLHECQCRFQRRVTRLCHDAAEQSEGKDREKWLRLAAEASDCLNLQRAVALPRD
jgi:hypothetical protein